MRFCLHHISDIIFNVSKYIQSLFFPIGLSSRQLCPYKRSIPLHCAAPAHPHKVHSNVPPWSSSPPPYLRQGIPANAWGRAVCVYLIRDSLAHSTRPPTKIITIMAVIITIYHIIFKAVCVYLIVDSLAHSNRPRLVCGWLFKLGEHQVKCRALVCGWLRSTHWHLHSDTHTHRPPCSISVVSIVHATTYLSVI